jgi:hypothetical protein
MSGTEVAVALGSPNIVTRDSGGKETWIYDKIATEASYSKSSKDVADAVAGGIIELFSQKFTQFSYRG